MNKDLEYNKTVNPLNEPKLHKQLMDAYHSGEVLDPKEFPQPTRVVAHHSIARYQCDVTVFTLRITK